MDDVGAKAKEIMDNFLEALNNANLEDVQIGVESSQSTRDPKTWDKDTVFVEKMLSNAPDVDGNCIVAEKKSW